MATDEHIPPGGGSNIPGEAQALLAECNLAAETVAAGLERLSNLRGGLPQAMQDELALLRGLAKQLVDAFDNLKEWLHRQFGVTVAGPAEDGDGQQP